MGYEVSRMLEFMKGFKIEINNEVIEAAVNQGVVVVTVDQRIGIGGIDHALELSIDWGHHVLGHGCKIRIMASNNIESNSVPANMKSLIFKSRGKFL